MKISPDHRPLLITALLWLSILPGQLIRWEFNNTSAGILISDIAVFAVVFFVVYSYRGIFIKWKTDTAVKLLALWVGLLVVSWVLSLPKYGLHNAALAFAYLIRLIAYLSLFVLFLHLGKSAQRPFLRYAVITVFALLGLGILVIELLPNFAALAVYGWDPHVGRLTSTWLDPNYFGTFLALVGAAALSWEKNLFADRKKWMWLVVFFFVCVLGIYATISRSALVTLGVAGAFAGIRTSWRAFGLTALAVILLLLVPSRLQSRFDTSISYVSGVTTTSISTSSTSATNASTDPTASERIDSWKKAWQLSKHEPVFGIGYNEYEPASIKYGLLTQTGETRGTAGSDSSVLTLLATTGWLGVLSFLAWIGYLCWVFLKSKTAWATAALVAIVGMAVGSQLNNALLYPLILLPFIMLLGIAYADTKAP